MSTSGDIMSTSGDIMSTSEDVQYIGDIMSASGFSIEIERILSTWNPTYIMIPPMY